MQALHDALVVNTSLAQLSLRGTLTLILTLTLSLTLTLTKALGPFIATLPSRCISSDLLGLFTQLATPSNANAADSDIGYYCALNFPGVAQA